MTEPTQDTTLAQATILLSRYGFEMKGYIPQELINQWLKEYSAKWIRAAIIEALYQGRYKAISVYQILKLWSRRKQITCHFTHEFERLICRNLLYSVDLSIKSSEVIPHEPKTSERKIQRKSFNPPVTYQQNSFFTIKTDHKNEENNPRDQAIENHLKTLNHETDFDNVDENHNASEYSPDSSSQQPHLINKSLTNVNQLTTDKDEDGFPLGDTKVNNPQNLKGTLTNLDELFTHFFTDTNSQKSDQSVYVENEDDAYQWRGIIAKRAIDEFTPQLDRSELYTKLKAVVQQELE